MTDKLRTHPDHHAKLQEKMKKRPVRKGYRNNMLPGENISAYLDRRWKQR